MAVVFWIIGIAGLIHLAHSYWKVGEAEYSHRFWDGPLIVSSIIAVAAMVGGGIFAMAGSLEYCYAVFGVYLLYIVGVCIYHIRETSLIVGAIGGFLQMLVLSIVGLFVLIGLILGVALANDGK